MPWKEMDGGGIAERERWMEKKKEEENLCSCLSGNQVKIRGSNLYKQARQTGVFIL